MLSVAAVKILISCVVNVVGVSFVAVDLPSRSPVLFAFCPKTTVLFVMLCVVCAIDT